MKILNSILLAALLAVSIGCDKDDDDKNCSSLESTIVGSWSVSALGQVGGNVEFKADGTLIDPDGVMIEGESGGVILDEKSYEVTSNEAFTCTAAKGSNFISAEYTVTAFSCDEITLDVFGIVAKLNRN